MRIGMTELLIILAIVVVIFGPSQIPKLSRLFGKSIKGINKRITGEANGSEVS